MNFKEVSITTQSYYRKVLTRCASNFVQKTGKSYHNNCQDTTHFEKKVSKTQKSKQIFEKRFETLIFFWDIGSTLDEGTKA